VRGQLLNDRPGQPDRPPTGPGLGRPEPDHSPGFGDDLGDLDRSPEQIDTTTAQAGQLPDTQATVGGDQDQDAITRVDHVR
jgi:hypothetical protein